MLTTSGTGPTGVKLLWKTSCCYAAGIIDWCMKRVLVFKPDSWAQSTSLSTSPCPTEKSFRPAPNRVSAEISANLQHGIADWVSISPRKPQSPHGWANEWTTRLQWRGCYRGSEATSANSQTQSRHCVAIRSAAARHLAPFFILAQFEELLPAQGCFTLVRVLFVGVCVMLPVALIGVVTGRLPQQLPEAFAIIYGTHGNLNATARRGRVQAVF